MDCYAKQRMRIMACYTEPVGVNHGVLYGASGFESLCVLLSQWLLIMVCIAEQMIVKQGKLCCVGDCESW
jgi:hypothetical protein